MSSVIMKCEIQDPERREQGKKQDHSSRFQESKLGLYKDLVGRISWDTVLKKKYVQESSMIAKDHLFQTQELSIPVFSKSNKSGRRPACMNRELCKHAKKAYLRWKQGKVTQRTIKILSDCAGIGLGKPESTCS